MNDFWADAEVISSYTRAQAIEDGLLVDVTKTAKEAGIKFPVAVTQKLWSEYITPDTRAIGQSIDSRLWDTLWMFYNTISHGECKTLMGYACYCAAKGGHGGAIINYSLYYTVKENQRRLIKLKAICHGSDNGETVITLMLPDEDQLGIY